MDKGEQLLWTPEQEYARGSYMQKFMDYTARRADIRINNYEELWSWSVHNSETFWIYIADFFHVNLGNYSSVLSENNVDTSWFPGSLLNYANYVYSRRNSDKVAIIFTLFASRCFFVKSMSSTSSAISLTPLIPKSGEQDDHIAPIDAEARNAIMASGTFPI